MQLSSKCILVIHIGSKHKALFRANVGNRKCKTFAQGTTVIPGRNTGVVTELGT